MSVQIRVVDKTGVQTAILGDVESLTLSPVICDAGAIEFSYPVGGANWDKIKDRDEFGVQVYIDGVRVEELDGLIQDVDGDDVAEATVWKFTGIFTNGRLAEATTYPAGWPNAVNPEEPNIKFTTQSAGAIMRTLMQQAQSRGTLTDIDFSTFSSTLDSNGVPWNKTISIEYAPQVDYLEIFQNLYAEQDMVEFQMKGNKLYAYNAGSMNIDHTLGTPPLVFRKGRDLMDSPRKRSSREVATALLASGRDGLYREVKSDAAIAARRRIEASAKQGQIGDPGTLLAFGAANLSRMVNSRMEKTHGLTFGDPAAPRPIKNFMVGDWAYSDVGGGLERLRIKQWVLSLNSSGELTGSVTLNDFFAEQGDLLNKRIKGIIGGSTVTGESRAVDQTPIDLVDNMPPAVPQGLAVTSEAYASGDQVFAQATATWLQVTTNQDGTILEDLERYAIRYRQLSQGTDWSYVAGTAEPIVFWSSLVPDDSVEVQVRAEDRSGNASAWSATFFAATGGDIDPPPVPSTPTGDNYLGLMRFKWDGKLKDNAPFPPDFSHIRVYASATTSILDATLEGTLIAAGSIFLDVPYGATRYVWLTSVDTSGNESPISTGAGPITNNKLLSDDIFAGAVGSAQLADLAVTNAKIALLAVNDANIGNLSVAKLTAGIMNANVTLAGRFATALTGARTEFNSLGFFRFAADGTALVAIDANGALITGRYRTAVAGRRLEMGSSGALSEINFYSPDGDRGFIRAHTEGSGIEAIQLGVSRAGSNFPNLWNTLNMNAGPNGEYSLWRSGTLELIFDGGDVQTGFNGNAPGSGRFVVYQAINRGSDGAIRSLARFNIQRYRTNFADEFGQESFYITRDWVSFSGWGTLGGIQNAHLSLRRQDGYLIHGSWYPNIYQAFEPDGQVNFSFGDARGNHIWVPQLNPQSSAQYRMFTGQGYGIHLKSFNDLGGVWLDIRQWDDSNWAPIRAANFVVNSDMRDKEDIKPADGGFLAGMTAKPQKFRRKGEFRPDPERVEKTKKGEPKKAALKAIPRAEELGLMVQELPTELQLGSDEEGYFYGQSEMNAYLWGAIRELRELITKGGK